MSDLRAFKPPRTGYPARSFYCTFCIISTPPSHPSGTEKAPELEMRALQTCASRLALQLHPRNVTNRQSGVLARYFIALSALFPIPSSLLPAQKKRQCFKGSRAKHAPRDLALRLELSLAISSPRAFQPPQTGYHARPFCCTSCIISIPPSHLPAQKKHRGFKCRHYKHASSAA